MLTRDKNVVVVCRLRFTSETMKSGFSQLVIYLYERFVYSHLRLFMLIVKFAVAQSYATIRYWDTIVKNYSIQLYLLRGIEQKI